MNSILEKNWAAIRNYQPELEKILSQEFSQFNSDHSNEQLQILRTPEGDNLRYTRLQPPIDFLYHQPNPIAETRRLLDAAELKPATLIIFQGFGLGHLFLQFLKERGPQNYILCVMEANPQIFFQALFIHDFSEIFKDPSIIWIVTRNKNIASKIFHSIPTRHPTATRVAKVCVLPAAEVTEPDFYQSLRVDAERRLERVEVGYGNSIEDQMHGLRNTVNNLVYTLPNPGFARLADQFKGKTIISVASGPALAEHWENLRQVQRKIPIIACDSALPKLLKEGIVPDFVTAMEREPIVVQYFKDQNVSKDLSLIAGSIVLKEVFDVFKGSRIHYQTLNQYEVIFGLSDLGALMPGHSAGNLNLVAAIKMGFTTLVMVGHNLGFAGENSFTTHFEGIGDDRDQAKPLEKVANGSPVFKTKSQDGLSEVFTETGYDLFRSEIEYWVSEFTDRRFINTAFKGVAIAGTETLDFIAATAEALKNPFNIAAVKSNLLRELSITEWNQRKFKATTQTEKALGILKAVDAQLKIVNRKLKEHLELIASAEKEKKTIPDSELDAWLDEILDFKIAAVDDVFFQQCFLSVILPLHIAFERELNAMPVRYASSYLLKRDVLKIHDENYFKAWTIYLPQVVTEMERALEILKSLSPSIHLTIQELIEGTGLRG